MNICSVKDRSIVRVAEVINGRCNAKAEHTIIKKRPPLTTSVKQTRYSGIYCMECVLETLFRVSKYFANIYTGIVILFRDEPLSLLVVNRAHTHCVSVR